MNILIFVMNCYLTAHATWWFLRETNRTQGNLLTPFLSRICDPFCRLFQGLELKICGNDATIAIPVLVLAIARLLMGCVFH